jgi:hypothetical protein
LGIGDWGLGIGDWGLGPIPNPHLKYILIKKIILNFNKLNTINLI